MRFAMFRQPAYRWIVIVKLGDGIHVITRCITSQLLVVFIFIDKVLFLVLVIILFIIILIGKYGRMRINNFLMLGVL